MWPPLWLLLCSALAVYAPGLSFWVLIPLMPLMFGVGVYLFSNLLAGVGGGRERELQMCGL